MLRKPLPGFAGDDAPRILPMDMVAVSNLSAGQAQASNFPNVIGRQFLRPFCDAANSRNQSHFATVHEIFAGRDVFQVLPFVIRLVAVFVVDLMFWRRAWADESLCHQFMNKGKLDSFTGVLKRNHRIARSLNANFVQFFFRLFGFPKYPDLADATYGGDLIATFFPPDNRSPFFGFNFSGGELNVFCHTSNVALNREGCNP